MSRTILICFLVLYLSFTPVKGGIRYPAAGSNSVALAKGPLTVFLNAGGLSALGEAEFSFAYTPAPFGLSELSDGSFAACIPLRIGALGISLSTFGFDLFRQSSFTLGYANSVADLHVGIGVRYEYFSIQGYGKGGTCCIDLGLLVPLRSWLSIGTSLHNINGGAIGVSREKLPQIFLCGIAFIPREDFSLAFDLEKELLFQISAKVEFEYWIIRQFAIRLGMGDSPRTYTAGIGLRYKGIRFDYRFYGHLDLGTTHTLSLTLSWGDL